MLVSCFYHFIIKELDHSIVMGKKKGGTDLEHLDYGDLRRLYEQSQGDIKKKGYDRSNAGKSAGVDMEPSADDVLKAQEIDFHYYRGGSKFKSDDEDREYGFGDVAKDMGLKKVDSVNDIQAMRKNIADEYINRQIDKRTKDLRKGEQPKEQAADAPKPEAKPSKQISDAKERVKNYESMQRSGESPFKQQAITPFAASSEQMASIDAETPAEKDPQNFLEDYKVNLFNPKRDRPAA